MVVIKSAIVKLPPVDNAWSLSQSALVMKPYGAVEDAAIIGVLIVIAFVVASSVTFNDACAESALTATLLNNELKAVNGNVLLETVPLASIASTSNRLVLFNTCFNCTRPSVSTLIPSVAFARKESACISVVPT